MPSVINSVLANLVKTLFAPMAKIFGPVAKVLGPVGKVLGPVLKFFLPVLKFLWPVLKVLFWPVIAILVWVGRWYIIRKVRGAIGGVRKKVEDAGRKIASKVPLGPFRPKKRETGWVERILIRGGCRSGESQDSSPQSAQNQASEKAMVERQ